MKQFRYLVCLGRDLALLTAIILLVSPVLWAQSPTVAAGSIQRFEQFPSAYVAPRTIDVWLPEDYDPKEKYAVLYLQDGQMLFDSTRTWTRQEWGVDETMTELRKIRKISPCIVVGIWNSGATRHPEYCPQKPLESMNPDEQKAFQTGINASRLKSDQPFTALSDRYLSFLVKELKPFIDSRFSTLRGRNHTFIGGSSMGGLISLYAICEYPNVFGGAACLSTHWPCYYKTEENPFPDAMLRYLKQHLPDPMTHRIYFDHGTATLDSLYEPLQIQVDNVMVQRGFGITWKTQKFPGENHSERAWAKRLHIPLEFLLHPYHIQTRYDGNPIVWEDEWYWGNVRSVESTDFRIKEGKPTTDPLNDCRHVLHFNKAWQLDSNFLYFPVSQDTTAIPLPVYDEYSLPVLQIWKKKTGALNSFKVAQYRDGTLVQTTEFNSSGGPSNRVKYEYHGDTTIAIQHYYSSLINDYDTKKWAKTVTIRQNGLLMSSVITQRNSIESAFFFDYEAFDTYGNWTKRKAVGELWGEPLELVTVRKIEYY